MKFVDHSPPADPTLDEQKDSLQKGLGRVLRWAREGRLDDDALLAACLTDQRYDHQCEELRGDWLWELITAQNAVDRFRVPILHALHALRDTRSQPQLGELAESYAASGDDEFRKLLYELAEHHSDSVDGSFAEFPLIRLDGMKGFLFAAAIRGRELATREWAWDDDSMLRFAREFLFEDPVRQALEASDDIAVRRFADAARQASMHDTSAKETNRRAKIAAIPAEEILERAEVRKSTAEFVGWGRWAPTEEVRKVVDRLWQIDEPAAIVCLLRIFTMRGLPEFDARLIELCRHNHEDISHRAYRVLRYHTHPGVREFALRQIDDGRVDSSVVGLFRTNFMPGDERLLFDVLEMPDDVEERHGLLLDVSALLEKNPEADPSLLGLLVYAQTPCSQCRQGAVEVLTKRRLAPSWMLDECRLDCDLDIRKLVLDGPAP
jgi:hypothetical protein